MLAKKMNLNGLRTSLGAGLGWDIRSALVTVVVIIVMSSPVGTDRAFRADRLPESV